MLAITGGTGHTGRFFIRELEKGNYEGAIKCLVRTNSKINEIQSDTLELEYINGTLDDDNSIRALLKNVDVVVHIANIHYSKDIIRIGKECGVKRFILVHTTGIYSKYKSASKEYIEIEQEIKPMMEDLDIIILRPTMIFGDICDYNISKFIKLVDRLPIVPIVDGGHTKIQPVNARDLAKALYTVLQNENIKSRAYDVSGATIITIRELYQMIAKCLGKKRIIISFPMWLCVFVAKVLKVATRGKRDLIEKVLRMGEDRAYNHEEATKDFGYEPEQFIIGLRREVNEYLKTKSPVA